MTAEQPWHYRRVLVTGATGLLGSWLTSWLVEQKAEVVALVRDAVPRANFVRLGLDNQVNVVRGGLEDYQLLERTINEYEVEVIFHIAAQTLVGIANRNPISTFTSNTVSYTHLTLPTILLV